MNRDTDMDTDVSYKGKVLPRLMSYVRPHMGVFVLCVSLLTLMTLLNLYEPTLIADAIDRYITGDFAPGEAAAERFRGVVIASVKYIGVLLAVFVCDRTQYVLIQRMGQDIIFDMRNEIFEHIQSLSMRFFDLTPVGKLVTRVTNDVEALNELFSNMLVRLFQNGLTIIGLAVIMLVIDARMALWSFTLLPVIAVLTLVFRRIAHRVHQVARTKLTDLNTFLSENLSGMKIIQIFNREKEKYGEFFRKSDDLFKAYRNEMRINAIFRPVISCLANAALVIVLWKGGSGVLAGQVTIGTLYLFVQYVNRFFNPLQEIAEQFTRLQSAVASAEKIFTLLDTEPMIHDPAKPVVRDIKGRIEFRDVSFAYDGEDYVLRNVSFVIEPGQKVAFVGATGAGKSSILNLIGRYYDVQKGQILIDGVDVRDMTREQIRGAIGQVQQDVFIFTGDISRNIRLRSDDITDERIREAAEHVNASRFIERLPEGYDEEVSERGGTLSAGQRQLLSFARTLAFDPKILILDEATANIDTETEQWIQEALERLMTGRTTIMVAHRLSTIQHADRIIVMHKGRIRESGTHQELLEKDGIYKKLYQLQLASSDS